MPKPRAAKRAKSYAAESDDEANDESVNNLLANLDLNSKSTTPKVVAAALLSLLPKDATKQHSDAKKLTKAFLLVIAELDARSNKAARQRIEVGASKPIKFSFTNDDNDQVISTIELPEDSFVNMLHFLDGHELAVASLVNKAWLSSIRLPAVWEEGFDMSRLNSKKVLNMSGLLKLIKQPQFANVKAFALPQKVKLGLSGVKQLAKTLPCLEKLDLSAVKAQDSDLLLVAEHFPSLNALHVATTWNISTRGIENAVQAMGEQLLELNITVDFNSLGGDAMEAIASNCTNLKYFSCRNSSWSYNATLDGVSGDRVVALVRACRHLETLELHNCGLVKQSHLIEIAELVANDLETYALRNIIGFRSTKAEPFDVCEVLSKYTFLNVRVDASRQGLGKGVMFWGKYDRMRMNQTSTTNSSSTSTSTVANDDSSSDERD